MLGYSEEELSHLENWDKIVHPGQRASSAERYAELRQACITTNPMAQSIRWSNAQSTEHSRQAKAAGWTMK